MLVDMYQIDAFSDQVFHGNPAAVCPLTAWLSDELMQAIAAENNVSETAFFVPNDSGFDIRWFTPMAEVDLCGHATLAAAFVIFHERSYPQQQILFQSKSGVLKVCRQQDKFSLDFPCEAYQREAVSDLWQQALGVCPVEQYHGKDVLLVFRDEDDVHCIQPNHVLLKQWPSRGVIVSAQGHDVDFVCRFFAPRIGIDEDPVTGSAHCMLVPYWAQVLQKNTLISRQVSKRGGELHCMLQGERVLIAGHAVKFMHGTIRLPC